MMSEREQQQPHQPQARMPDPPVNRSEERPERRSYTHVDNEKRNELIALLETKTTIKNAAIQVGINYECAKAIYRTYRLQDRTEKKSRKLYRVAKGVCSAPGRNDYFIIHRKTSRAEAELGAGQMTESGSIPGNNDAGALIPRLPSIKLLAGYR